MQETIVEFLSQARSAWRFRWYGVVVAWVVALGGWSWLALQSDIYEATTTVYVDISSALSPLLDKNIVETDITSRLQFVRQALLSRAYLERLAAENGLDAEAVTPRQKEWVVEGLREGIVIEAASTRDEVNRQDPNSIFTISYRHPKPETAVAVVTSLLNVLIEDTAAERRKGTDTTEQWLDERIREYESRLKLSEQALTDFRRKNSARLPDAEGSYFERIQKERDAVAEIQRSIRLAESRKSQIQSQLSGEAPVAAAADGVEREPPPNSIDARIRDQRVQLDQLLRDFTDIHPDVVASRETLERLEKQREDQLRALGVQNPEQQISGLGSNPVYQALQIALNEVQVEIATLTADAADRQKRLNELRGLVNEMPGIEAEMQRLSRDYDDVRRQYQVLIQSRETQTLSRKAWEADQQTEFRVLNPPRAGLGPVAPPRLILMGAVLIAALGAGGGLCYLLAQLKPTFTSRRALSEAIGLPVIGAVSYVLVSPAAQRSQRVTLLSFGAAVAGLMALFAILVLLEMMNAGLHDLLKGAA